MNYSEHAIETVYAGARFRSRLEARWAAFFDLAGWKWIYEPFDCKGWIPDFGIAAIGAPRGLLLVEVKPIVVFDQTVADRIDQANDTHEVLLVGIGPRNASDFEDCLCCGWLRENPLSEGEESVWGDGYFGDWTGSLGVRAEWGSWHDRITGVYGGSVGAIVRSREPERLWREAGNKVRWERQ